MSALELLSNVDEGWWYLQGRKMRVNKRERERLYIRGRVLPPNSGFSTTWQSQPVAHLKTKVGWRNGAGQLRNQGPFIHMAQQHPSLYRTLAARGHIWLFWRLYNSDRFVFMRCREREKEMDTSRAIFDVIRQYVKRHLNLLSRCNHRAWTNIHSFFFLHIDIAIASRRSMAVWCYLCLVSTGFHGHVCSTTLYSSTESEPQ